MISQMLEEMARAAHQAAADRLHRADRTLYTEDYDEVDFGVEDLAGPYCGCETCIIREVLDAGFPVMARMAVLEWEATPIGDVTSWGHKRA